MTEYVKYFDIKNTDGTTSSYQIRDIDVGDITTLTTTAKTSTVAAINELSSKGGSLCFCFTSGKVDSNGEPNIVNTDGSFNVSPTLKGLLADGTAFSRDSIDDLDVSSLSDGTYRLFLGSTGTCVPLVIDRVYRQRVAPTTPTSGMVWLDMSVKPYVCKKYDGSAWQSFNYVPLPQKIVVASGAITSVIKCDVNFGEDWQKDGKAGIISGLSVNYTSTISTTLDVSSYLPSDDYDYAILGLNSITCNSTSTSQTGMMSIIGKYGSKLGIYGQNDRLSSSTYRANPNIANSGVLIVDTDRSLSISVSTSTSASLSFTVFTYRRLGVN